MFGAFFDVMWLHQLHQNILKNLICYIKHLMVLDWHFKFLASFYFAEVVRRDEGCKNPCLASSLANLTHGNCPLQIFSLSASHCLWFLFDFASGSSRRGLSPSNSSIDLFWGLCHSFSVLYSWHGCSTPNFSLSARFGTSLSSSDPRVGRYTSSRSFLPNACVQHSFCAFAISFVDVCLVNWFHHGFQCCVGLDDLPRSP